MPMLRARCGFGIAQKTGVKLCPQSIQIQLDSHESKRLPAITEWLVPFLSPPGPHVEFARVAVPARPPFPGSCVMKLGAREVESTDEVIASRKPEKSFRASHSRQSCLEQIPEFRGMKWLASMISKCADLALKLIRMIRLD